MFQELKDYATRENLAAEPGFIGKEIAGLLVFSSDGTFLNVQDGRYFPVCPYLTDVELKSTVDGKRRRHFLADSADIVTLFSKKEVDEKLIEKHELFVAMLEAAAADLPHLARITAALRDDEVLARIHEKLSEAKIKPTASLSFAVVDESSDVTILLERDDWHDWWRSYRAELAATLAAKSKPKPRKGGKAKPQKPQSLCLMTGEPTEPAGHLVISGLAGVGGQPSGDRLMSFYQDSFQSFGLDDAAHASMSEQGVKTYVTALNDLIKRRSKSLGGAKVVYWYTEDVPEELDVVSAIDGSIPDLGFATPSHDEEEPDASSPTAPTKQQIGQSENRAAKALEAIHSGERPELGRCQYIAITLSANAGRVVIRDVMRGPFQELAENVNAWFDDLSIVHRYGRHIVKQHKFLAVVAAPVRELKEAPASIGTSLFRVALDRKKPIPLQIVAQTLARVRIDVVQDQSPSHARLGLLKAFCNRHKELPDMSAELKEHETNVAYLCGRIMAILARIQRKALGDVGAGVVQRYYAAASATPALVLGKLVRTAQTGHLPKIDSDRLRGWFEKELTEVWSRVQQAPPTTFSLEEQTLFAMGYYQQNAARYTSKDNDNDASKEADVADSDES